ncbi:MAG: 4'-phosphopantetheinyl transferase superfamily protein [Ginsengibacter sp.]
MPLFYQHNINDTSKLAVWHLTENEDFFLEKVSAQKEITHPHKRLQHLAGRYLLQILDPEFPLHLIRVSASGKPLLPGRKAYFSISHCGNYAAAIISENKPVGIDVEMVTPKIEMIKNRFLSESEINLSEVNYKQPIMDHQLLTLFWSSKETVFKWFGKGQISFRKNINLARLFIKDDGGFITAHLSNSVKTNLKVEFKFFGTLCLSWVTA